MWLFFSSQFVLSTVKIHISLLIMWYDELMQIMSMNTVIVILGHTLHFVNTPIDAIYCDFYGCKNDDFPYKSKTKDFHLTCMHILKRGKSGIGIKMVKRDDI